MTHPADCPGLRTALEHLAEAATAYLVCCGYHDANGVPCAPDERGGYCCDDCPTLNAEAPDYGRPVVDRRTPTGREIDRITAEQLRADGQTS